VAVGVPGNVAWLALDNGQQHAPSLRSASGCRIGAWAAAGPMAPITITRVRLAARSNQPEPVCHLQGQRFQQRRPNILSV